MYRRFFATFEPLARTPLLRLGALPVIATAAIIAPRPVFAADWGEWEPVPDQYQAAVDVRLQSANHKHDSQIRFQFRNKYDQPVTVAYVVQGIDASGNETRIEGSVDLKVGEQHLDKKVQQTVPFSSVTGVAFAKIVFSRTPPKPSADGARYASKETRRLEHDFRTLQDAVLAAESAKFDAQNYEAKIERSAERQVPLVLGEGHATNMVMESDDVAKARMNVRDAIESERRAREQLEAARVPLEASRLIDRNAMIARQKVSAQLAAAQPLIDAANWPAVSKLYITLLADPTLPLMDADRAVMELNLGTALEKQGESKDAEAAYREAVRLDSANPKCRQQLKAFLDAQALVAAHT